MKFWCKNLFVALFFVVGIIPMVNAVELSGNVAVNQVSDTAANAKSKAMNLARRQILFDVLSQYTQKDYLNEVLQNAADDELLDLVASTSVANEHISSNAYSANVTMNLDNDAVKNWLNNQGIQNWIPSKYSDEKFTAFIVAQNGLADWAELKRVARDDKIDIETQNITGNQIVAKIPVNYRSKFTVNIRKIGWKYTDNGGILQIWK